MNHITWRELQEYLNQNSASDDIPWDSAVTIYDINTGEEYKCDTFIIDNHSDTDRLVLAINMEYQ